MQILSNCSKILLHPQRPGLSSDPEMEQTFTSVLLLLSLSAAFGKYVYIQQRMTWHEAQMYCRTFYTDLAPVSNNHDINRLQRLAAHMPYFFWIGMERSSTDKMKWMWSGGGEVSTFFWALTQPNNRPEEDYGSFHNYRWHDAKGIYKNPFFCYSVVVVRERKTWEEALEHCREHHHDLASVASETEMMLIQEELGKNLTTEHVWMGLHFFSGNWLWVDRQPLDYEAWGQENKSPCPKVNQHCAALQVARGEQSNRTDSPLVSNATEETGENTNDTESFGKTAANAWFNNKAEAGVNQSIWEARDCEERLHFICY